MPTAGESPFVTKSRPYAAKAVQSYFPLIALMQDQVTALCQVGIKAATLNSTIAPDEAYEIERAMRAGELDLVYVAPERLLTDRVF